LNSRLLGKTLTAGDPLLPFARMLLLELGKLPADSMFVSGKVYRALSHLPVVTWEKFGRYSTGDVFCFNNFNSTSVARVAAEQFLGKEEPGNYRVFLELQCLQGFDLARYSEFPDENEILIPPGSEFRVVSTRVVGTRVDVSAQQLPPHPLVSASLGNDEWQAPGQKGRGSELGAASADEEVAGAGQPAGRKYLLATPAGTTE
jgi:hypothetical protein